MPLPRPTIFLSYASEDRPAVLLLRTALETAGLDVWYDANELGGGDAWDQKIRRQIRECDYFMPVISATTERRKEGYFRREWRLAAERTMDMADDVMFLIPAVLDDTSETGARVPEKFVTVQWLRVPGGQPTPALEAVAARLAGGDHAVPPLLEPSAPFNRPRVATTAPFGKPESDGPPPMPPFPHLGDNHNLGHRVKFFAEVLWWLLTVGWMFFKRAPRWLRIIFTIWFVIWGFSVAQCRRNNVSFGDPPPSPRKPVVILTPEEKAAAAEAIKATVGKLGEFGKAAAKPENAEKLAHMGSQIAHSIASELKDTDNIGKDLVAVPFALGLPPGQPDNKFVHEVFAPLYGKLLLARPGEVGLSAKPLPAVTDEALVAVGHKLVSEFVLGARLTSEAGAATLTVRLMKIEDDTVAWTAQYPVAGSDPATVAEQIAAAVLAVVPKN